MDKELIGVVGLLGLVFVFILPSWVVFEPDLTIDSVSKTETSVSFSATYSAPVTKSCYLVVYGPFAYDGLGHEEGNNIYVLTTNTGTISDTLTLQGEQTLSDLKIDLWCDNDNLIEVEATI
ncbi:MAG: hypothetical protein GOU98_04840 [Candidatus Altiarchaeota archaeon]|nr:hypothetical protein [Candidatus Altiarchaeota archaeon]